PGHFVAKAVDGDEEVFFDPFHGGRLLTVESCEAMVARITDTPFRATAAVLESASLGSMVQRMLNNLKGIYWKAGDFVRAARVAGRLHKLLPTDSEQARDLGVCLLYANQAGRALDHLTAYLANVPRAEDARTVEGLVRQARSAIARWN
ncbi:MAG TPA: tetratricopeptide repeat protein, partial [Gemmataceae bacterium]|nr:tetratricopeptide repeat protein [Gemmataceae bacterium]